MRTHCSSEALCRLPTALCRLFWRPETGIFLALWLVLLVGGRSRLFRDPGTLWHTRLGQQMLATQHLVYHDPFSFTFPDEPWIPHQWLGEIVMALVHALAGWDSLLLVTVTLLAGLYTWLAGRLIRAGLHWSLAISLTALTLAASSSHFHVRPHLSTLVFFGVTCAFLNDFEMGRIPPLAPSSQGGDWGGLRLFWLVPMYALWTNLHGGMLGGLATMILALAGWIGARLLRLESPLQYWRQVVPLGVLILACGLTAFVNPYGARLPQTWLTIMTLPHLTEIIQEHRPLEPTQPDGALVVVLALVYVAALAGLTRPPRVTWLLPLVWLYLASTRIRHAPLFAIAASLAIADIFPHTRWAAALVRRGSDLFSRDPKGSAGAALPFGSRLSATLVLPVAIVLAALVLQMNAVAVPVVGSGWATFDPELWPLALSDTLRHYPEETRIFNEMNLGGFLMYHAPHTRIFVDDRCELYRARFLKEYVEADDHPEQVERWARDYRFELALAQTGSRLDVYFRQPGNGWTVVESTRAATLYRREATPR